MSFQKILDTFYPFASLAVTSYCGYYLYKSNKREEFLMSEYKKTINNNKSA